MKADFTKSEWSSSGTELHIRTLARVLDRKQALSSPETETLELFAPLLLNG